jgi:hypothetical protein
MSGPPDALKDAGGVNPPQATTFGRELPNDLEVAISRKQFA